MTRSHVSVLALLGLLAFASISGGGLLIDASASGSTNLAVSHDQWDSIVEVVNADPDLFAGVSINAKQGTATIHVTQRLRGSQRATMALDVIGRIAASPRGAAGVAFTVIVAGASHSFRELSAAMDKATNDLSWRRLADPYLAVWYADAARNAVNIGVTQITPQIQATAQSTFRDLATLTIARRLVLDNRQNQVDVPPWWGGDGIQGRISPTLAKNCTGGFPVANGMLTAGHCYTSGTVVHQPTVQYRCMGSVTDRTNGGGSYDYELINVNIGCTGSYTIGSNQGSVYYRGGSVRRIGGMGQSNLGDQACFDGAVTEENCTANVSQNNICATSNGITYCHLDKAESSNLTRLVTVGDSGGPVYKYRSGSTVVLAQGIIVGEAAGAQGVIAYYTPMWRIIQDHHYTLVTCGC